MANEAEACATPGERFVGTTNTALRSLRVSDNFQTPDEIADDLSASLSDVSDAIDDGSRLDVGNLDDVSGVSAVPYTANVVEDVTENADNAADGFAEETFEITESIEADSAIDDVFDDAEPFAEAPVNNPFATPSDAVPPSSASLPPVRESASSPTSSSFPTASPSQGQLRFRHAATVSMRSRNHHH